MQVSAEEKELLKRIGQAPRFPIVRFELRSSRERSLISTALNHVYLERETDSMEQANNEQAAGAFAGSGAGLPRL